VFAAPAFINSLMIGPLTGILPTIYAKYYGVDLAVIGMVLMFTHLFDAVTDPVIGYLSDNTKTRIGRRKPWMLAGYGLLLFAVYRLFIPPDIVTPIYFAVYSFLFYLFFTMAEVPFSAWQMELSHDYVQRSRVVTYRTMSMTLGSLIFAVLPYLPVFSVSEFTPEVLRAVAFGIFILIPFTVLAAVFTVPEGKQVSVRESTSILELLSAIVKNKPFLHFIAMVALMGMGGGMWISLEFVYFDTYLLMGDKYPIILGISMVTGLLAMPLCMQIVNQFGRGRTWAFGALGAVLLIPLIYFFAPKSDYYLVLILIVILSKTIFTATSIIPPAMLGDIIDYDTLKSGTNRSAQYSSFLTLVYKGTIAFSTGLGFFIIKLFKYDATIKIHDIISVFGLKLVYIVIPTILFLIVIPLVWFFPITPHRHAIIKKRIESRYQRAQDKTELKAVS